MNKLGKKCEEKYHKETEVGAKNISLYQTDNEKLEGRK
jgi:hypothetical protein